MDIAIGGYFPDDLNDVFRGIPLIIPKELI